jgi:hypothetical protein
MGEQKHAVMGRTLGHAVCTALGIDPSKVSSVSIHMSSRGRAQVSLMRCVYDDEAKTIRELFEQYHVEPNEQAGKPHPPHDPHAPLHRALEVDGVGGVER